MLCLPPLDGLLFGGFNLFGKVGKFRNISETRSEVAWSNGKL